MPWRSVAMGQHALMHIWEMFKCVACCLKAGKEYRIEEHLARPVRRNSLKDPANPADRVTYRALVKTVDKARHIPAPQNSSKQERIRGDYANLRNIALSSEQPQFLA